MSSLLRRLKTRNTVILGDKGYDSETLYKICEENNNRFWAPIKNAPHSNQPPKRLGRAKRNSHKQPCTVETRRSLVESTFYSLKTRVRAVRARLHFMKKRELAWHVLARNLEIKISFLLRCLEILFRFAHQA